VCIYSSILRKQPKGAVVGYRIFDVGDDGVHSLYNDEAAVWPRSNTTPKPPTLNRNFGFHALSTLRRARNFRDIGFGRIAAKVRGSGVVVRHRTGFRSSRMTILRFYVPSYFPKSYAAALRSVYRVPVEYLP